MKKWDTVVEVHKTLDIPEAPNRSESGKKSSKAGIPLPPPPPPQIDGHPALLKAFNKTNRESPESSFYSPGSVYKGSTAISISTFYEVQV